MPPPRPPNPPPPRPPGPPGPRPNVPPGPPGALAVVAALSLFWPNPKLLLSRTFNVKRPGPVNALMGTSDSPGCGIRSKEPKRLVTTFEGMERLLAKVGRSLKIESPFKSWPVVILYGVPEFAVRNGLNRKA